MAATPDLALQSRIIDDKSPLCIPFILSRLQTHQFHPQARPFILALSGLQGIGKTTLAQTLSIALRAHRPPYSDILVLSIDDLYLPHSAQLALSSSQPHNALIQHRGLPGTHDLPLSRHVFNALCAGREVRVPVYDKSAHNGAGDRAPESVWPVVNRRDGPRVSVILLEGWCLGFRALPDAEIEARWRARGSRTLHRHTLEHVMWVNEQLRGYEAIWDMIDALVHIDAEEMEWVYEWRLEQEAGLRRERGTGMTDEQVVRFVDGYYPAYELYLDGVRNGMIKDKPGCQLRLIVGRDRCVKDHFVI